MLLTVTELTVWSTMGLFYQHIRIDPINAPQTFRQPLIGFFSQCNQISALSLNHHYWCLSYGANNHRTESQWTLLTNNINYWVCITVPFLVITEQVAFGVIPFRLWVILSKRGCWSQKIQLRDRWDSNPTRQTPVMYQWIPFFYVPKVSWVTNRNIN